MLASHEIHWTERIAPCPSLIGEGRANGRWIEPLRVIYDHELVLFRGGPFTVEIEGHSFVCPDESFIIIPPAATHVSRIAPQALGRRQWVHFDWIARGPRGQTPYLTYLPGRTWSHLYRFAPEFVPASIPHGRIARPDRVFDLFERLERQWLPESLRRRLIGRAVLLELLSELLCHDRGDSAPAQQPSGLPYEIRTRLDAIAEMPVAEMPSVQNCLREMGYSYEHLARVFRQAYGIAPIQYINAIRIERARILILGGNLSFSKIASRVGYDSPGYFCRQFRKHTGQSPTEFSRTHRDGRHR